MNKSNRKIIIVGILTALLLLASGFSGCQLPWQKQKVETPPVMDDEQTEEITVVINNGVDKKDDLKFKPEKENSTAYDMLKKACEWAGYGLETKDYDFGKSVEKIGDYKAGQDGKYWMYYLNGKLAPVAVDKQKVSGGDKLEFKFEKGM